MNLGWWLKEYYAKYKRQRWDFWEEFMAWHFAKKCAALKFAEPWMWNHFSFESRDRSYVASAMCPECPTTDWRGPAGYTHGKVAQRSSKDQVEWLHFRSCLVPSWCGASRIIWNSCWSWGITSPLWAAAPRPSLKEKKTWKWWKIYWNRFCEAVMDIWFIFQVHIIHMNEIKSKLRWKQLSV